MAGLASDELILNSPLEQRVAAAWARVRPWAPEPTEVTLLKRKRKSAIYRLAVSAPGATAVVAKRCERETARVERAVYAEVLARLPVSSLRYYGCVEDPEEGCGWLFLEECVAGKYAPALDEHRRLAGRWLGLLHTSAAPLANEVPLPDRGLAHFRRCLQPVCDVVTAGLGNPELGAADVAVLEDILAGCDKLAAKWGEVEELCARMPRTLVHGDFIRRNLRVRAGRSGLTLVPFDWEMAGWGVPAIDLMRPPFSGRPDLVAYWEVVREWWPAVDLATVGRWAEVGNLFRFLAAADWAVAGLGADSIEKSVSSLAIYREELADTVRAFGWGD
jgi:Phosphotransferase enzyme family